LTAGLAAVGGIVTLSLISTVSLRAFKAVVDKNRRKVAPPCQVCKGKGFVPCKLCKGSSTVSWSPLFDPVFIKPCVCPTCEGNRVQRCLNCIGNGF
ncbi:hypothetical protein SELMODRAFT_19312, partial [Selaginella moellendorffii]